MKNTDESISEKLLRTTEAMANMSGSGNDMQLWNEHSNACLEVIDLIKRLKSEMLRAEGDIRRGIRLDYIKDSYVSGIADRLWSAALIKNEKSNN